MLLLLKICIGTEVLTSEGAEVQSIQLWLTFKITGLKQNIICTSLSFK